LPSRYGDLTALVSGLPPQPTQELRLSMSPSQADAPRFEIVLPPVPTPAPRTGTTEATRVDLVVQKSEETRKVTNPDMLARLSHNPARTRPASRIPRGLLLGLGAALLMFVESPSSLIARKPDPAASTGPAPAALAA